MTNTNLMSRTEALEVITKYHGNKVEVRNNKVYDPEDNGLFAEMELSALGSADQKVYDAFKVINKC